MRDGRKATGKRFFVWKRSLQKQDDNPEKLTCVRDAVKMFPVAHKLGTIERVKDQRRLADRKKGHNPIRHLMF
jgi:hypothetical protein